MLRGYLELATAHTRICAPIASHLGTFPLALCKIFRMIKLFCTPRPQRTLQTGTCVVLDTSLDPRVISHFIDRVTQPFKLKWGG